MKYVAYILKSESLGTYYYGSTKNIEHRLMAHNKGKVRYTKGRRAWVVHYYEVFESRSGAYSRELFFKSVDGYRFLKAQQII